MDEQMTENLIFHKILDISPDGFIIVDDEGVIINVNEAYRDFVGIPKEQIIGQYITDIIPNSKLPNILTRGKTEIDVIHRLSSSKNPLKEKVVAATRASVEHDGKVIGAFGQIKFSKGTQKLAKKFQKQESELEYYKNELKKILGNKYTFETMIGRNKKFLEVKQIAEKAAKNDFSVLILGDTGTGKEVFAHSIHFASERKEKPFIRVNCAAIPADLIESELFGYEEGAFTGAKKGGKIGKFEMAHGGTLFLDEIGELPMNMQAKLLRVLQEQEVERVGGLKTIPINVRIIAATNRNLEEDIVQKKFREDLYYRLNVIQIEIPSLNNRKEDISDFIHYFLNDLNDKYGTKVEVSSKSLELIVNYPFPGNIRELKNIIESSYSQVDGDYINSTHLPSNVIRGAKGEIQYNDKKGLNAIINDIEKEIILDILKDSGYNCRFTAKKLGIHRSTLYKKFEKYDIKIPR